MSPRILVFVSKTGGGHISLAEALQDLLCADYQVEIVDPQPGLVHYHYRLVSRNALWLWQLEFKFSDRPELSLAAHKTFTLFMKQRVARVIQTTRPDLIITTYPFLTYEIVSTLRDLHQNTPFIMLQADPNGVHQSWLTERNADLVFCPTQENYTQALQAGFSPRQIYLSGWPVRSQFYHAAQTAGPALLEQMGLRPDCFTIFLQGGGEGAARFGRTVENLLSIDAVQVILAVGTNQALEKRFQNTPRLHVLPFTRQIASIMNRADIIMGKAGPNMIFESMVLGKPFIATSYIPGQEQLNLEFIERHRLGWVALNAQAQRSLIETLISEPARLEEMKKSVADYRDWNSSRVTTILPMVKNLLAK